ncbi:hypothetical protein H0264_15125 [Nocardia huaxiensis]|uniref:Uncharacterized protein n=1 Tax=Nocardia huaxiensis TaxID=2755382 RepID=A0A7D6VCT7_9NOCA|nr:hypothetical protein H0264_15125 [Nocardia huaxiensis]
MITETVIDMGIDGIAQSLMMSDDRWEYRSTMRCLLGREHENFGTSGERRKEKPTVIVRDNRVTVLDKSETALWDGWSMVTSGLVTARQTDPGLWDLSLHVPSVLSEASWESLSLEAPNGWLTNPAPWPPTEADSAHIVWSPYDRANPPDVVATLRESTARRIVEYSYTSPYFEWEFGLSCLAFVIAVGAVWTLVRRSHLPVGFTRTSRAYRTASRISAAAAIFTVGWLGVQAVIRWQADSYSADTWMMVENWSVAVLLGFCAICYGVGRLSAGLLVLVSAGVLSYFGMHFEGGPSAAFLSVPTPIGVTTKAAVALMMLALGSVGFVQALRSASNLSRSPASSARAWLAVVAFSTFVLLDRLLADAVGIVRIRWLALEELSPSTVCCTFDRYSATWANEMLFAVPVILAAVVWGVLVARRENGDTDSRWLIYSAVAIFTLAGTPINTYVLGFRVPQLLVIAPVMYWLVTVSVPVLDRRDRDGRKLRDRMQGPEHARLRDAVLRGVAQYPETTTTARLPNRVSAVDALLAVGPHRSPIANARTACRLALMIGLPIAILVDLWAWHRGFDLSLARQDFLSGLAIELLWEVALWTAVGITMGLLWQWLPGRWGLTRVSPLIVVFGIGQLGATLDSALVSQPLLLRLLAELLTFSIAATLVGLAMDHLTLRPDAERSRRVFLAAYGLRSVASQATFLLAQIAAVLAIVSFLRGQGDAPSAPSVDPPLVPRPNP